MNSYRKPFDLFVKIGYVDVYGILDLYEITNSIQQHSIKKLLAAGNRNGGKEYWQDIAEAADQLIMLLKRNDKLDMMKELKNDEELEFPFEAYVWDDWDTRKFIATVTGFENGKWITNNVLKWDHMEKLND